MTDEEFLNRLQSLPSRSDIVDFQLAVRELFDIGTIEQRLALLEYIRTFQPTERQTPLKTFASALGVVLGRIREGEEFLFARELRVVLSGLEFALPRVLAEQYPYWKTESLDGFYLSEARKIGPDKAEMRGVCILITDQTITPFHLQTMVTSSKDDLSWLKCWLGKRGDGMGSMERVPWSEFHANSELYLQNPLEQTDWVYEATFGVE